MLKALTNREKVMLERTFDAQRGVGKSVDLATYLHAYPLAAMRVGSTITGESHVWDTKSVCGFGWGSLYEEARVLSTLKSPG
jgi:hypothetical protein